MIRLVAAGGLLLFVGSTLVLGEVRWFRRRSLASRVSPYIPGGRAPLAGQLLSAESFGELLRPVADAIGSAGARLFGVNEELPRRLQRVHWDLDPAGFRLHQFGWSLATAGAVAIIALAAPVPHPITIVSLIGGPLLAFLIVEQRLATASDRWKQRVFREVPIVAEQIAMLLGSGHSLGSALTRVARRGSGAIATDLEGVVARVRQGTSEIDALREWADLVDVDAVRRLVSVLALNRESGDLGSLVAAEARTARAEAHRALIESIERRSQQVWIPVTVATLIPGILLMAIPFFDALRTFGS